MIECACEYEGDCVGIFDIADGQTSREYRECRECGATIWPWEKHRIGYWWDCEDCPEYDDDSCEDAAEDLECRKGLATTSDNYCCATCANVCDHLLCGCWWVGRLWRTVADRNEITMTECLGEE